MLDESTIEIWEIDINNQNLEKAKENINNLSKLEREKLEEFKFKKDYQVYLITHVAMRELISRYTGIKANKIEYGYGEKGKPKIKEDIYFNLSHTDNKGIIGFYKEDIGVDIEYKKEIEDYDGVGELVFTKEEIKYINNNYYNRKERFYEIWTKKEAVIKSTGEGLNEEVKNLSVGTRNNFYCGRYIWQIKKIKIDEPYIAHIAYKNWLSGEVKLYNFSFK
jgi:4'-phosphopantetheinyl transferase